MGMADGKWLMGKAGLLVLLCASTAFGASPIKTQEARMGAVIQNECLRFEIAPDGRAIHFIDRKTGTDYCAVKPTAFARVTKDGREFPASEVRGSSGRIRVRFGESGIEAVLKTTAEKRYLVLEVVSLSGEGAEQLTFVDVPLTLKGTPDEPFAACSLALNLKTNVSALPGSTGRLWAICTRRLGFAGAKAALIGCPQSEMRDVIKDVVTASGDLPHSPVGGPWALNAPDARASYLFNFDGITEQTADDWIRLAKSLGITQIDFHGGSSFRFGDCRPNPARYPNGFQSLKAVIDKLHAAGIQAGLHTYSFCIAKDCPWVTPVPDPRLGKDATFTLAEDVAEGDKAVTVRESTEKMSTVTGFFVRNSVTLQVDDELITYTGISKEPPYSFTGCTRDALGTRVSAHRKGAKAHHLKEVFGLFVPDGDSTLFTEVAAKSAEAYNTCGFDMIYLDALDAEDIFAGARYSWHYGSKFVFELFSRLEKPALMEMSTFHHHLWYVRSRMGAWDHPSRAYKDFIDSHCAANESNKRMFLPSQLGWWAVKTWDGAQGEPTFPDDIEYLCLKGLANDTGLALMGITPEAFDANPYMQRLAGIMQRYENLRRSNTVPESIKARLREPGKEFSLGQDAAGMPVFRPIRYDKHRVEGMDGWSNVWTARNDFAAQPVRLRIEALLSAGPYGAPDNVVLADFGGESEFSKRHGRPNVTASVARVSDPVKIGDAGGRFTAKSGMSTPTGAWTMLGKKFAPTLDISARQGMGVWIHGDGRGEVLNIQLRSPLHVSGGIGDHYVVVDFTGWRYFELIEPEGERFADYSWPYHRPEAEWDNAWPESGGLEPHWVIGCYGIYRERVNYGQVESLNLWYNNLPPGQDVTTYLSPIKALPLVSTKLVNPKVTIGGKRITFPVEIESGCYLEFNSPDDCKLYNPQGVLIREVKPEGDVPILGAGENRVSFETSTANGVSPRARVTIISEGQPIMGNG